MCSSKTSGWESKSKSVLIEQQVEGVVVSPCEEKKADWPTSPIGARIIKVTPKRPSLGSIKYFFLPFVGHLHKITTLLVKFSTIL